MKPGGLRRAGHRPTPSPNSGRALPPPTLPLLLPRPAPHPALDFSKAMALLTCFMTRSCDEGIVAASMKDEPLVPPGTASPSIVPAKDLMSGAASQPAAPPATVPAPEAVPSCPAGWGGRGGGAPEASFLGAPSPGRLPMGPAIPPGCWPELHSAGGWLSFPGTEQGLRSHLERSGHLLASPPSRLPLAPPQPALALA